MTVPLSTARERLRAAMVVSILATLGVFALPAAPASAHAALVGTTPWADTVVQELPAEVVLTFTESVQPVVGRIKVIGPDGQRADRGEPHADGTTVVIPLTGGTSQGTYLVSYRVLSSDSHPIGGAFAFGYGRFSETVPPSGLAEADEDGFLAVAFPVVRWLGYGGLILLVGAVLALSLLWPKRLERKGPVRLLWVGAGLVALATVLELFLQVPYVAGGGLADVGSTEIYEVLKSQYGLAHLVRLGLLTLLALLLRPVIRGEEWGWRQPLFVMVGVLGLSTWPISGHPVGSPVPVVTLTADLIHLAAMSVWVGGLVMLVRFLIPRATPAELAEIVPAWSRYATFAVAALLLTGVAQAVIEVGTVGALFSTTYGWLVVAKAGLFAAVMGVALLARRLVGPIAAKDEAAAGSKLRQTVAWETTFAAGLIGVASVLVQTTPARTPELPAANPVSRIAPQYVSVRSELFELRVRVDPATTGVNFLRLYAFTLDGKPATVAEWRVKAAPPDDVTEPLEVTVLPVTPDHANGQVSLPVSGTWKFSFTLRTTDIDQATVTLDVAVR